MSPENAPDPGDRLEAAYERMMQRVHDGLEHLGEEALPPIQHLIDSARETAEELDELTREEAGLIAEWVRRDLHDAGHHLAEDGREMADWLKLDLELVESELLGRFMAVADQTSVELLQLAERAREAVVYESGEVTAPGMVTCQSCGYQLTLTRASRLPPCPQCQGTSFRRSETADAS